MAEGKAVVRASEGVMVEAGKVALAEAEAATAAAVAAVAAVSAAAAAPVAAAEMSAVARYSGREPGRQLSAWEVHHLA